MLKNISAKGFVTGFIAGSATGAIISLLTAPKSGQELRSDIKQKTGEYYDDANKYVQDAKSKASEMIQESKQKYSGIINEAKSKSAELINETGKTIKDAKDMTSEVISAGKEKIDSEIGRFKNSVKVGKEAYNNAKSHK